MVQLTEFFEGLFGSGTKKAVQKGVVTDLVETSLEPDSSEIEDRYSKDYLKDLETFSKEASSRKPIYHNLMENQKTRDLFFGDGVKWQDVVKKTEGLTEQDFKNYRGRRSEFDSEYKNFENEQANKAAEADKNKFRTYVYNGLINAGLEPTAAKFYSNVSDFVPLYGDASGFEDAIVSYRDGQKTAAALQALLATVGLAPVAGDIIKKTMSPLIKSLKGPELVPAGGPPLSTTDNLETINEEMVKPSEILAGERGAAQIDYMGGNQSKLVRQTSTEWEQWKANNLSDEDKLIIPTNNENLANRIAELSPEGREKALAKLEEMWQKNGVTIGLDGRPVFEINDSVAKFAREEISLVPKKLSEVLEHEELFKAYPKLKDLAIRFMSPAEIKVYTDQGQKAPLGIAAYKTTIDPLNKDLGNGPVLLIRDKKVLDDHGYNTLFHEIQHFVQVSEGKVKTSRVNFGEKINKKLQEKLEDLNSRIEMLLKGSPNYKITGKDKYYIDRLEQQKLNTLAEINYNSQRMNPANKEYYNYENTYKEIDARAVGDRIWDSTKKINSPWTSISAVREFSGDDIIRLKNTKNGKLDLKQYIEDSLELAKKLEYENPDLSLEELDKLKTDFFFTKKDPSSYRITVGEGFYDVATAEQDLSTNYFKEWVIDNTDHLNPEINELEYNEWLESWGKFRDINVPLENIEFPDVYNKGGLMSRSI